MLVLHLQAVDEGLDNVGREWFLKGSPMRLRKGLLLFVLCFYADLEESGRFFYINCPRR